MTGFVLGARSLSRLVGVEPRLVQVVMRAIKLTTQDFMVLEGVRSDEQAWVNWGKGRTKEECVRAGVNPKYASPGAAKVTWLRNPLATKHRKQADGFGHAVDLVPFPVDWNDLSKFDAIANAMLAAAKELDVPIRYGGDWDGDGNRREKGETDSPHFELGE